MRLRTVDLNLLVTLVAECSVSKAALRMGLTNWWRRNDPGAAFHAPGNCFTPPSAPAGPRSDTPDH
jgi:hypothetical protein